jgi:hypothetical protein
MATDTSHTIDIHASPTRLLALLMFSVLSTGLAAALAFGNVPNMPDDRSAITAAYSGLIFFGFCAAVAIWRLIALRGPVVTISPEGLRDRRIAPEVIRWRSIAGISTWQMQRQLVLIVKVDPAAEARLSLTRVARWMRTANRAHGTDGLVVSAHGLKVGYPTLFYTCRDYWETWRGS